MYIYSVKVQSYKIEYYAQNLAFLDEKGEVFVVVFIVSCSIKDKINKNIIIN